MKCFLKVCLLALFGICFALPTLANGIVSEGMLVDVNYWVHKNKNGNKIVLDKEAIRAYNERIHNERSWIEDLVAYPNFVTKSDLSIMVNKDYILRKDLYLYGKKMSDSQKAWIREQASVVEMGESKDVRYAVTVNRVVLRALPFGEPVFYDAYDTEFEAFLEVVIDPAEPLIVLHESANGDFYFVQSVIGTGWISKYDIAFASRDEWLTYADPRNFLVVIGKDIKLATDGKDVLYQQGARLPFAEKNGNEYKVLAPVRAEDGSLLLTPLSVYANEAVHDGYQTYTFNNIIRAAFQFYGEPYGWGGLHNSVDCSALLYNAFRTVGILLPRNGELQMNTVGDVIKFDELPKRKLAFRKAVPGMAAFFYEGDHVMIYLGKHKRKPYFIHALSAHIENGVRKNEMRVLVSDASLRRANGKTYLDNFDRITAYK